MVHTPKSTRPSIDNLSDNAFIRLGNLHSFNIVPFSSSTVWRKVRSGEFPSPIKVSAGVTAWRVGDIRHWLQDPAGFSVGVGSSNQLGRGKEQ
jgi:prophage regulatory protein